MILALISSSHIIGAAAQYGINTFAPFYQQDLNLSRAQVGLFFTAFYSGMAGLSLAAGWLADRLGVRRTTLTGHLALGIWIMTVAMSPSFSWAFTSFFLAGLGYSFLNPASTKGVMTWFDRDKRATAMGIKQTGVPAGGVVTALLGAPLVLSIGWRGTLAGFGALNLLFGLLFWMLWHEPEGRPGITKPVPVPAKDHGTLKVKSLLAASSGTALFLVGQMSLLTYVPLYLKETLGLSAYWASQALAVTQMGAMLGRTGWGAVSDRIFHGRRKIVLIIIGGLSAALSLSLSLLLPGTPLFFLVPLLFAAGLCMIGYHGVSYSLIGELAGQAKTGTALGLMVTINSVGTIFATPIFGYLVDVTGSYPIAWRALSGTILLGTLAFIFFLKEPKP
ncbi:MAG: MFS transporter [Candidatus Binatia bacterium]